MWIFVFLMPLFLASACGAPNNENLLTDSDGDGPQTDDALNLGETGGQPSSYMRDSNNNVPVFSHEYNDNAIGFNFYAPGLSDGYVSQGISFVKGSNKSDDKVLVGTYYPDNSSGTQPHCKLFVMNASNGRVISSRKIEDGCRHAGGVAVNDGNVFVSDTKKLFKLTINSQGELGKNVQRINFESKNGGPMISGSFASFDRSGNLWLGEWEENSPSFLRRIGKDALQKGEALGIDDVEQTVSLPRGSQGVTFVGDSNQMWVSASNSRFGCLYKMSYPSNKSSSPANILQTYRAPRGIEDLEFGRGNSIWSVSESGSLTYMNWLNGSAREANQRVFFPLVFNISLAGLTDISKQPLDPNIGSTPSCELPSNSVSQRSSSPNTPVAACVIRGKKGEGKWLFPTDSKKTKNVSEEKCQKECNARHKSNPNRRCRWGTRTLPNRNK
jgi:hypothetical protein